MLKSLTVWIITVSSVQSLSQVRLLATPWTAAHQASLSIINSQSLLKLMSIELVMPSNHLILCCPLLLLHSICPSIRSFQMSQLFASDGQSIGVSASTSILPMNIQEWFPLGWTGWISLQPKGLSRVFSNTTVWNALKEMGIQDHLTCLLRKLDASQEATVRTLYETTDWFRIEKGVQQGCLSSPCLFNFYAEHVMRNAGLDKLHSGIKIGGRNINNLEWMTPLEWQKEKRN